MLYSVFGKILLVLLIVGGLNWGIYGIWGLNAVGWLLGGSLGWLARAVFIVVGVAALALIPALFAQAPHHSARKNTARNAAADPTADKKPPRRQTLRGGFGLCGIFCYRARTRSMSMAWMASWLAFWGTRVRS